MTNVNEPFSHSARRHSATRAMAIPCATVMATAASVYWIDRPLARAIARWLPPGRSVPQNVPDLLVPFVASVSGVMLVLWIWSWTRGGGNRRLARLAPLLTLGLPLAFGLKELTKWAFGRTETRMFLSARHACDFCHWFDGHGPYTGFPSGHMLVIGTLILLLCAVYPKLRYWSALVLTALGAALMATSYHFLGDVLAGGFFAYVLALLILKTDAALRSAAARRRRP